MGSLISVPFQFNYDSGYVLDDAEKAYVNVQPVIPFSLNDDWNLISRNHPPDWMARRHRGAVGRPVRPWRHNAEPVLLSEEAHCRRHHLGRRSGLPYPDRHRSVARQRSMGRRANRRHPQTG